MRGRIKSAAAYYIGATYALRVLCQLPLSDISTSCDRVVYLAYVPYLGINLCHRRMQLCAGETAPSSSPLPFCRFLCSSETAVNYGWTLSASCWIESEPWKAGRTVGTTCACASAYGRRDALSPVGLCLLCLGLSGFHSVTRHEKASVLAKKSQNGQNVTSQTG